MFLQRVALGMLISVAGVLGAGACSRGPESEAAGDTVPRAAVVADGDGAMSFEQEGWFDYKVCVLLKGGPTAARVAFCASQLEDDVRARCRAHVFDSSVSWANWCYNEFAE